MFRTNFMVYTYQLPIYLSWTVIFKDSILCVYIINTQSRAPHQRLKYYTSGGTNYNTPGTPFASGEFQRFILGATFTLWIISNRGGTAASCRLRKQQKTLMLSFSLLLSTEFFFALQSTCSIKYNNLLLVYEETIFKL